MRVDAEQGYAPALGTDLGYLYEQGKAWHSTAIGCVHVVQVRCGSVVKRRPTLQLKKLSGPLGVGPRLKQANEAAAKLTATLAAGSRLGNGVTSVGGSIRGALKRESEPGRRRVRSLFATRFANDIANTTPAFPHSHFHARH